MNNDDGQDGNAPPRLRAIERLQELRARMDDVQRLIDALKERRAAVREERLCVAAEYRLLADDGCPRDWANGALEQERALLREENILGREWLRLLGEQRLLRQERLALLAEQARLFKARQAP